MLHGGRTRSDFVCHSIGALAYFFLVACSPNYAITSRVPVEGKSSVCLICMKYRIIILIINIITIILGQILLNCILQTHHARRHARMHTHARHTCAHTHRRRRRTGYSMGRSPNHDGPLSWRQCRSLAIEINTGAGGPVSPRFWMFFGYNKILGYPETRTRDSMYCQSKRTVRYISKNCDLPFAKIDRQT